VDLTVPSSHSWQGDGGEQGKGVIDTLQWRARRELFVLWWRMVVGKPATPRRDRCMGYSIYVNDGQNVYMQFKDIFVHRIYHFTADRADPLILDCGGNIGMAVLYFKGVYPRSRIISFEPDPVIFPYLRDNVGNNGLSDVTLVQGAMASREGQMALYSDGKYGSCLAEYGSPEVSGGYNEYQVPCVRLRNYLKGPVDFLKMNIEGAEWEVLADSEDSLRQVREMVIEYHHLPGLPRTLHKILELLDRQGFEYLINDFDTQTNGAVQPPFSLSADSRYFLLIYARQLAWGGENKKLDH